MNLVVDFLARNNNLDSLIILVIGLILGNIFAQTNIIFKKMTIKLIQYGKTQLRTIERRIKGTYNTDEIIKISEKPKERRTKKEQAALDDANRIMQEAAQQIEEIMQRSSSTFKNLTRRP